MDNHTQVLLLPQINSTLYFPSWMLFPLKKTTFPIFIYIILFFSSQISQRNIRFLTASADYCFRNFVFIFLYRVVIKDEFVHYFVPRRCEFLLFLFLRCIYDVIKKVDVFWVGTKAQHLRRWRFFVHVWLLLQFYEVD